MSKTYREKSQASLDKSQIDFEKTFVYLTTGALVLSMGFTEKIVQFDKASCKCIIIISWGMLASALLLNLASHLIAVSNSTKACMLTDEQMQEEEHIKNINRRNKEMRIINWVSYLLFALGVILVIFFCAINII